VRDHAKVIDRTGGATTVDLLTDVGLRTAARAEFDRGDETDGLID